MLKNNSQRAYNLIVVFSIVIISTLLAIISGYLQLNLLEKISNDVYVSDSEIDFNDNREMIIALIQSIVTLVSIFLFLSWFRRAYGNLRRIDVKTNYSESWAIWSFVIPIISLFRPYQIMNEVWTKTQKTIKKFDINYIAHYNTIPILFWWILFIGSNIVGRYILKYSFKDDTLDGLIKLTQAHLISDSIQIVEALLVLFMVSKISKMEDYLFVLYKKPKELDIINIKNE